MLFVKLIKYVGLQVITCTALSVFAQQPKQKSVSNAFHPQEKKFKVHSRPFDINGMHVQFQYIVKYDEYADKPKEKIMVLDKKLVDLKRKTVLVDFPMEEDDTNPAINLSDIKNAKYSDEDFDDVNFDGYKDIREVCQLCGGSMGIVESVYLFNHHTKDFQLWTDTMGINVELDPKEKTVRCYTKGAGGGTFDYQEIKFAGRGVQLYEKTVSCNFLNEKRQTFKVEYSKYNGKKRTAYKTRIINSEQSLYPWTIIEEMTK
jgi:hypothetical protein